MLTALHVSKPSQVCKPGIVVDVVVVVVVAVAVVVVVVVVAVVVMVICALAVVGVGTLWAQPAVACPPIPYLR